ncbi:MAG: integrin alpha, partial [Actinomycetota bacterium]
TSDDVILGALGDGGWIIKAGNDERQEGAGEAVGGGHDVNGDGIPDVIVGAPVAAGRYSGSAGAAFVIFGKSSTETVVLDRLADGGFLVQASESSHSVGEAVALIPDLGADGFADILVGDPEERGRGQDAPHGAVYHLVGQSGSEPVDLGRLGSDGVRYRGSEYEKTGAAVAMVGDFDDDGAIDLAAGSPRADGASIEDAGKAIIFTPVAAPAFDNPPTAQIISYSAHQRAKRGSFCWDGRCVDKVPAWPAAEVAGTGDRAHFRISFDEEPGTFSLRGYRELDDSGLPSGPAISFPATLKPIRHYRGAPIAGYEAVFDLPNRPGHLYLVGAASWPGDGRGDASWFAHLRLREQAAHTNMPRPPDATLRSGNTRQRGAVISYCWSQSFSNGTGVGTCADGIRIEPRRAEPARTGAPARIRIHSRYRPDKINLRFYRAVRSGYPSGESTRPRLRIEAHRKDGRIRAWDVVFRLPNREGHLYPLMDAQWDQHGSAPYDWHLSLR